MVNKNLAERTPAEELWLSRKAIGRTQGGQAAWLGVSRSSLQDSERNGPVPMLLGLWQPVSGPDLPLLLALARRRSGLGLTGVARRAGVSRVTVLAWEKNEDRRLLEFWAGRGFTFA